MNQSPDHECEIACEDENVSEEFSREDSADECFKPAGIENELDKLTGANSALKKALSVQTVRNSASKNNQHDPDTSMVQPARRIERIPEPTMARLYWS
jgi:hypothetical protein